MKPELAEKFGIVRRLAGMAALVMLSVTVFGQQVVPGASVLEAEVEEIRRYSVELIIFEYVDRATAGTEIFDPDEPPPPPEDEYYYGDELLELPIDAVSLLTDPLDTQPPEDEVTTNDERATEDITTGDRLFVDDTDDLLPPAEEVPIELIPTLEQVGVKFLGAEDYVLNKEYDRLMLLDAYRPVMHAAWTQPTLEKDLAIPIKLRRLSDPPLRLDGTMTLYLSRFLHLVVDLELEEKSTQQFPAANNHLRRYGDERTGYSFDSNFITPSIFYRIEEDRIVRNGELRYYDHPRFGVLAKITRVEEEQPDEGDDEADLIGRPAPRTSQD